MNLSRMQEQAVIGGLSDGCICAALCIYCSCNGEVDAEHFTDDSMEVDLEDCVEEKVNGEIM